MLHSKCVPSRAMPQVTAGMPQLMRHASQRTYALARARKADMQEHVRQSMQHQTIVCLMLSALTGSCEESNEWG